MTQEDYMCEALEQARLAAADGETPVGCVVASPDGAIIGRGRNRRERSHSALAHAELEAIDAACRARGDWRLSDCALYVTLEPCPMCAGAIIMSRVSRVVYGARDDVSGSCGGVLNLFIEYGTRTAVTGGVLESECAAALAEFFRGIRE
jgi:tRNA(adenine34) deaminase